ncbi:MAG: peptide chain release factor N(5)-glutamine methyltransferase [Chloroflexia bacterium]|nr:peptide chain release factor N(5)-glutamine methyltransferase [Chloroflexia bacterium]
MRVATRRLAQDGSETPRLDAEVLLRHTLDLDRTEVFLRAEQPLGRNHAAAFFALVERRIAGQPVAYLTGFREFMSLPFHVNQEVLIPRPETEVLVEWALGWLAGHPHATVVDVGTGSGAIAISLAAHMGPGWRGQIIAADVSVGALAVAARNRTTLLPPERQDRVRMVRGSLLEWSGGSVDLVLANLPYLTPEQMAANPALAAEPALALDGGGDGLTLMRALVADLPRVLSITGAAGMEVDPGQIAPLAKLISRAMPDASLQVLPDLAGLARHAVLTRTNGGRRLA